MMDGWYDGMGAGWWVLMTLFWVVLIGVIVWAGAKLFSRSARRHDGARQQPTAFEILDERLARGELDPEAYEALREKLRAAR
jgi:putative membrane protein